MPWKFIVADENGVNIGEPRATGRSLTVGVSAVESASFQIAATDPLWTLIAAGDCTLKVFDTGGNLCFYGDIVTDEEVGSGQGSTVQVSAASVPWRLGKRFTGRDTSGVGSVYTSTDSGTIITTILAGINADQATGITIGTVDSFTPRTVTYLWKRVLDALNELGAITGSYEWQIGYTDGHPPACVLNLRAQLGTDRASTVFLEYGAGTKGNCSGYTRTRTIDQAATRVWALGQASTLVASAADIGSETFRRYEDVLSYGDIVDAGILDALATVNVAVRKTARTIVNLTPFPATAPKYGVDWHVGDIVSARVMVNGQVRVQGAARIWGADIQISDIGNETASLRLVPQ